MSFEFKSDLQSLSQFDFNSVLGCLGTKRGFYDDVIVCSKNFKILINKV